MVTMETADSALKSFYLDAVSNALNLETNPLLAQFKRTTQDVVGKDVKKYVKLGFNGGIGAGTETGALPTAQDDERALFTVGLKNLYGTIEISDKAIRASANDEGAFVNLLNDEMQTLVKSASFNFGRMLYGDGSGFLAKVTANGANNEVPVTDTSALVEGMWVDVYSNSGTKLTGQAGYRVVKVNHEESKVTMSSSVHSDTSTVALNGCTLYAHDSRDNEITGLKAIFENATLYGVNRESSSLLSPYIKTDVGAIDENDVQKAMDSIEENSGSPVNFIVCSWGVRRALAAKLREYGVVMPSMKLEGGYNALSFNGIPVVADRFCPKGTMYLLNTDDFKIHQLCDWKWLEGEDGKVLKQIAGKPVYTATLVKYAELMCGRPNGQGMLSGITEA